MKMSAMNLSWVAPAVIAAALGACATPPEAPASESLVVALGASPGVTSAASGKGVFSLDPATRELTWMIEYVGLSGPAVAAHIHGPADPGANAGVVVPFASAATPISGSATLTEQQTAELLDGRYYVNIHTAANPGGEIRGQIEAD